MTKTAFFTAAALAACAAITPASAKPFGSGAFPGCCGGFTGHHHGGWGGGISVGFADSFAGGDCYTVRQRVFVPGIGMVSRRQLVCE